MEKYLEKLKALGVKDEEVAKNLLKEIINDIQEKDIIHLIIYYQTGSSFETHNDVDIIDYPWNNISIAKENEEAIRQHYKFAMDLEYVCTSESREKLKKEAAKNWWYVEGQYSRYSLKLKKNDGTFFTYSTPWIGYFERLDDIEIKICNS